MKNKQQTISIQQKTEIDIFKAFKMCDEMWIKRKRQLSTASLFNTLTRCCIQGRGVNHVIRMENESFSMQAVHYARKKVPTGAFREINSYIQRGPHENRVFAVDGSKVHVHPSFLKDGYKTRTNDKPVPRPAKRPLVMLSSMVDVRTKTCVDFDLTKHFNERTAATTLLRSVKKGDILVFDRGYFSRELLRSVHNTGAFGLWRLKINAFGGVRTFSNSQRTEARCLVSGVEARLVKYFITGKTYVCLTNNLAVNRARVKALYASRWRVEESFKRLKSNLKLEKAHALKSDLYIQEIEARVLLDTITLRLKQDNVSYIFTLDTRVLSTLRRVVTMSWKNSHVVSVRGHLVFCGSPVQNKTNHFRMDTSRPGCSQLRPPW